MHWLNRHRVLILAAICILVTSAVVGLHYTWDIPFFSNVWRGEQNFQDLLRREGRKTPTHPDFVFLGIDQQSEAFGTVMPVGPEEIASNRAFQLMAERPYPWSRELWALLLDRLFSAGARLVMFDILFNSNRDGDDLFHAALDRYHDKVVLAANYDFSTMGEGQGPTKIFPNETLIPPHHLPNGEVESSMRDDRVGFVVMFPDFLDKKIRSVRYTITDRQLAQMNPQSYEIPEEALSARALEKLGHGADVPRDLKPYILRFSSADAYQPNRLWEVFDDKVWNRKPVPPLQNRYDYDGAAFFKDKVVIVGSSSQVSHDVFETPLGPLTPGPSLHLHAMAAAMAHEFLYDTPITWKFVAVIGAGVLAFVLLALIRKPLVCLITLLGIAIVYLGAARVIYDQLGALILVVPTMTAFMMSGLFGLTFEYTLDIMERLRTRRTLERYVSKNLVKEILENPDSYYHSLLGVRVPATILFSDLVGFTTLSEKADPEALVKQLNEYLTQMTTVVFKNAGTLDKFIGDAIMCVWGNVKSFGVSEDARCAVRTALGMRKQLQKLNDGWKAEGRMGLGMGIGINQGEVIVGNIGSHERMDPTVIGDSVNLASRLEALTRQYAVDVLIGATAAELVRDEFYLRSVARVQVKGKSKPVDVFTLIGARNEEVDAELVKWMQSYEEGIDKFRDRDFEKAKILFSRFLEFYPDDFLAKMYLERALEYEQQPPDEAWNAVEVFKKK